MQQGVVPTEHTERELAEAFSASPEFAASLVEQARRFRALLAAAAPLQVRAADVPFSAA